MMFIELFTIIQNDFGVLDLVVFGLQVPVQLEAGRMLGHCDL